ncbi:hypothetical protein DFH11DRAFT_430246 [Phellopilus nigrolimitatus]|nr:hypothetical protein DFH11DRAFT_430246 [Phellopilus nigrolimitatus]
MGLSTAKFPLARYSLQACRRYRIDMARSLFRCGAPLRQRGRGFQWHRTASLHFIQPPSPRSQRRAAVVFCISLVSSPLAVSSSLLLIGRSAALLLDHLPGYWPIHTCVTCVGLDFYVAVAFGDFSVASLTYSYEDGIAVLLLQQRTL